MEKRSGQCRSVLRVFASLSFAFGSKKESIVCNLVGAERQLLKTLLVFFSEIVGSLLKEKVGAERQLLKTLLVFFRFF